MARTIETPKTLLSWLKVVILLGVPITLLILPSTFFDSGETVCLSHLIFDMECYACGLTRAVMHMIHFEFQEAWEFNRLVVVVLPLAFLIWLQWLLKEFGIKFLPWL